MGEWLATFSLTVVVELAIAAPILGGRVRTILAANVLTHPLVFFLAPIAGLWGVLGLELFAAGTEALLYTRVLERRDRPLAIAASFCANAASLASSVLLWY